MSCHGPAAEDMQRGAYIHRDAHRGLFDAVLAFCGDASEIERAAFILSVQGVVLRLVRVNDWAAFAKEPIEYRERVFPPGAPVMAVAPDALGLPDGVAHIPHQGAAELAETIRKAVLRLSSC